MLKCERSRERKALSSCKIYKKIRAAPTEIIIIIMLIVIRLEKLSNAGSGSVGARHNHPVRLAIIPPPPPGGFLRVPT